MLQDVKRGRRREIGDLNGYAVEPRRRAGMKTPCDVKIVELFHQHGVGTLKPDIRHREPLMARRP
jgi:ketopantoate reductase